MKCFFVEVRMVKKSLERKVISMIIRFWWQNDGVFSSSQRQALQSVSLSAIICDNTHIGLVPLDPFSRTLQPDGLLPCTDARVRRMNLSAWREADAGTEVSAGRVLSVVTDDGRLCVFVLRLGLRLDSTAACGSFSVV